jgi:tetratricopeptide (TPR) repeat protein
MTEWKNNKRKKLEEFFDSEKSRSEYIEKYEENEEFFNELLHEGTQNDIERVLAILIYKYIDSLLHKKFDKKAYQVIIETEKTLEVLKGKSKMYDLYLEGITFCKGRSLSWLKRNREAIKEFEKLLEKNPDNETFKYWYKENRKRIITNFFNRFLYIAMALITLSLLLRLIDFENRIGDIGIVIIVISLIISWVWKYLINKSEMKVIK